MIGRARLALESVSFISRVPLLNTLHEPLPAVTANRDHDNIFYWTSRFCGTSQLSLQLTIGQEECNDRTRFRRGQTMPSEFMGPHIGPAYT